MTPLSYLSDEFDFDTFETHLLIDQMEKEEQANIEDGESVLSSTPIRYSQNDNKEYKTEVDLNDVSEVIEEDTVEDVSTCNSPSADLPTILITPEADPIEPDEIRVPILGYDVMESRSKFTVYKIEVERSGFDRWFVFRRYNDFYQLHDKLKKLFPNFRLALPSRRWFRDNYDKDFLEDRTLGLQAFLNNITGHKDICNSKDVRDFFCFDDPPGPHDSLEESRALCDNLEETIYVLRKELSEKDEEIDILHEELSLYKNQVEILTRELREKNKDAVVAMSPVSNQLSLAECDQETGAESDQSANSCHSDGHLTMIKSDSEERKQEGKKTRNAWTKKDSNPIVEVDLYHS